MKNKNVELVQQFIKMNRVQELALGYNEVLDLIQILASTVEEMSVTENVAVFHYLPLFDYQPSVLLKDITISRLGTLLHVEVCSLTSKTASVNPMQEIKRVDNWMKLIR